MKIYFIIYYYYYYYYSFLFNIIYFKDHFKLNEKNYILNENKFIKIIITFSYKEKYDYTFFTLCTL